MKKSISLLFSSVLLLSLAGCKKESNSSDVISQKYTHKYGYAVSKDEFESRKYPGQIETLLKNGVHLTSTYENGLLHGPASRTYPHSHIVEAHCLYNQGKLVREKLYDISGMPVKETVQLTPSRHSVTHWYTEGTPLSMEEFAGRELIEGQYFNKANELDAQVVRGKGTRIERSREGVLLAKEIIEEGYAIQKETFHPNGTPESIAFYLKGELHGEKSTFTPTGEPVSTKEYVHGKLHGKSTFFKNGAKNVEISYLDGMKNGLERQYIDGESIAQEILWSNDKRHGPTKFYVNGKTKVEYYYDGNLISENGWKELTQIDEKITHIVPEAAL